MINPPRDIWNQGNEGTCVLYSIVNLFEACTEVRFTKSLIDSFYDSNDFSRDKGEHPEDILDVITHTPFNGVKVIKYEKVYKSNLRGSKPGYEGRAMRKMKKAFQDPNSGVITVFKIRGERPYFPLDENFTYQPMDTWRFHTLHAMYCLGERRGKRRKLVGYDIENSWGTGFGDGGVFNIKLKDIWGEVHTGYTVTVEGV